MSVRTSVAESLNQLESNDRLLLRRVVGLESLVEQQQLMVDGLVGRVEWLVGELERLSADLDLALADLDAIEAGP